MHRLRLALQQSDREWHHTFDAVSDWVSVIDLGFQDHADEPRG